MTDLCPEIIGSLAFGLHMQRSNDLEHELPEGSDLSGIVKSDYSIADGIVRYSSIETRNHCAAQFVYEKNQVAFESTPSQWVHLAFKMWRCEITNEDKASGRLLSHVNREHDVFSLAAEVIKSAEIRTYDVLHVVEAALPYLNEINLDGLLRLCITQHESSKNDSMAGMFYNELEQFLINKPEFCVQIHGRIQSSPSEQTQGLYQLVLTALAGVDADQGIKLLLHDSESSNVLLKNTATWTIGLLLSRNQLPPVQAKAAEYIILRNISSEAERVRLTAIGVAGRCLLVTKAFDNALEELAENGDEPSLCSIAESLFLNLKKMKDKPTFEQWVRLLSKIDPESHRGIDHFDFILSHLIEERSHELLAIEILTDWTVKHGPINNRSDKSVVAFFGSTSSSIIQNPELLSQVITDWYLADRKQLATAATSLLDEMNLRKIKSVKFNRTRLDSLDPDDVILLARRLIGFVTNEDHLFSLVNSLLETNDAKKRTFGIALGLFVNELGEDYPRSAIEFLEAAKALEPDSGRKALYSNAIQAIRIRIDALESLPRLSEFQPNPDLERELYRAREKQMGLAMEEANKNSVFHSMTTTIPIKAGLGLFSHREGKYSETSYLQSFSTEMSIPRRTIIDEVGQEIQRFRMRNAKRGEK